MPCATCGSVDVASDGSCSDCAAPQPAARCGACGADLPATARFCANCGRPALSAGVNGWTDLTFLRSRVPPLIAQRVLQQGSAMIGERKRVTVLFADIRGSTALIDALDPEEAMATIGPIMQILMDAVHAHNGFVNQTRGDGIMALFGAPIAGEEHAIDACAAALEMRATVDGWAQASGRETKLRIGLNSGEVIIQSIGSDLSMNYDAVGRTVHLAARMETEARPGAILMAQETAQRVMGFMQVTPAGILDLKGVASPVPVFELEATRAVTRWQVRKAQGLSAFLGRQRDLETLQGSLASVERGAGRLVSITAAPGLGKSRLVEEFLKSLPPTWSLLQCACAAQRTNASYHPIAELIRSLLGATVETPPEEVRTRLAERFAKRAPALHTYIPAYLSLLDLRAADAAWSKLEPGERRLKVMEAIHAGITVRSAERPLLIIIEDMHWCDPETRFIIEHIGDVIQSQRVLLLITQRPDNAVYIPAAVPHARLHLQPLDDAAARDLAQALLGSDISLAPVATRILDLAQGNPLFIEELVQDLKGSGKLGGTPGNYRLAASPGDLRLPDSIHSVIAARIDQLAPRPRAVLQTAAVIGREVPTPILAHMMDMPLQELADPLAELERTEFLYSDAPNGSLSLFKHELIRDVAYRTLMLGTRRALHAKAVEFIETAYADRLDEHIDRLADHAFEAHLWAKALPYQMRSCRRALRKGASHEAIAICERAAEALEHVPESPDRTKAQIDFALAAIIALEPLGLHQRITTLLREASRRAAALADPWRIAAVNCQLVVALWRIGEHGQAMIAADEAEQAAASIGDTALMFAAKHNRGIVDHETGNFATAIAAFRDCLKMETAEIDAKRVGWAALPSVVLRTFLADSLLETGDLQEAFAVAEDGFARAEAAGHAYSRVQINQVRAHIRLAQGRAGDAIAILTRDWRTSVELDLVQMHPIIATRLGQAHLARDNVAAALDILSQPDRLDVPLTENAFGWRYLFLTRGLAYLRDARIEDAQSCAERALVMATERGERPQQAYAHALLAEIAAAQRLKRPSRRHAAEALRLAEACGMRPLAARSRAQLASGYFGWLARLKSWLLPL